MAKETFEVFSETENIYGIAEAKRVNVEPSSFNGLVRVRKFKITVEEIEEKDEIIIERLKTLRREEMNSKYCNWHNITAIDKYFKQTFGEDAYDKFREDEDGN